MEEAMRRKLCLGAATFVVLLALSAAARADLSFPQPRADAGEVRAGVPLAHRFDFVNDGPGEVEVVDLRASCGCARPRLEKRTYAAGEKGSLLLEVNTLGEPAGPRTWRLQVLYRAGDDARDATLELTGRVVTEVMVRPAALTLFTGSGGGHEITLTDLRPQTLAVSALRTTSPHLTAEVKQSGNGTCTIALKLSSDCPDGRHEEAVHILTDDALYRDLTVPVTVVKRPRQRVIAGPASVSLSAPPGQPLPSRLVQLRTGGEEAVVVERVESDDAAVACTWKESPNGGVTLKVTADRARVPADGLRTAIHVHVSKPTRETVTIPVRCER
jgi:hypothetical protein